jgi:hypothetical protein
MGLALGYALVAFVGLRASREDLVLGWQQLNKASPWSGKPLTRLLGNRGGD